MTPANPPLPTPDLHATPMVEVTPTFTPLATIAMAAQGAAMEPEPFQAQLVANVSRALLRTPSPPCLLRAPTGSGKTFVMGQVLERVCAQRQVVWFWFVPFVTLVQQTEDALRANATSLAPCGLNAGRNQDAHPGMVLLATAQSVARAQWRTKGYDADGDDTTRTLAAFVERARARGLAVGLVVDEAHIGLDKGTEFGKFAHWLKADLLLMATATPKDDRLNEFLVHAGYNAQMNFAASRDEVVQARLNKKYIEAVVYSLGQTMAHLTDLRRTVLRQAWRRNQKIQADLTQAGIALVPLLLVQVANGDKTVDETADDLVRLCGVAPGAIGRHSADEPDPVLMAAIANDSTKQVLVFKQSAGTGFDAPRAFVLASTKPVNDADFAMQFIGRVMRVARPVRHAFAKPADIPADLNTAYVYLGNAVAQAGFEEAVKASTAVQSQLEGQTEKLAVRQTVAGGVVYTNRPTEQEPAAYDWALPTQDEEPAPAAAANAEDNAGTDGAQNLAPRVAADGQGSLFNTGPGGAHVGTGAEPAWGSTDFGGALDAVLTPRPHSTAPKRQQPKNRKELLETLAQHGLRAYPIRHPLPALGHALKTEEKPELGDMSAISVAVATRLVISDTLRATAIKAALNRLKEKERHTELTTGDGYTQEIQVFTDRSAVAREAMQALRALPQTEEEDYKLIVQVLASRLRPALNDALDDQAPEQTPNDLERQRLARDAAHWVIRKSAQDLCEAMFSEIAQRARMVDAKPLPDAMLFPQAIALEQSSKNIYGVIPPSTQDGERVPHVLLMDERQWLADKTHTLEDGVFCQGQFDGTWFGNTLETAFSRALDGADFVVWWHRNPRNKPYAVKVVRAEHENYFYPDFVVCVRHTATDVPLPRLMETKDDTKDAARKAQHSPAGYGKVLFLTPDGKDRMRWVKDDGSLGDVLELDNMQTVLDKLAATRPSV